MMGGGLPVSFRLNVERMNKWALLAIMGAILIGCCILCQGAPLLAADDSVATIQEEVGPPLGPPPPVQWDFIFADNIRHTLLMVSLQQDVFQFLAGGKKYVVKHPDLMELRWEDGVRVLVVMQQGRVMLGEPDLTFMGTANLSNDFAVFNGCDKGAGRCFKLVDLPGFENKPI